MAQPAPAGVSIYCNWSITADAEQRTVTIRDCQYDTMSKLP